MDEQVRGSIVQGIGGVLYEECRYDLDGNFLNEGNPKQVDAWINTCTGKVHKGRLVQGKKINIDGQSVIVVDVEPCE